MFEEIALKNAVLIVREEILEAFPFQSFGRFRGNPGHIRERGEGFERAFLSSALDAFIPDF